MKRIITGFFICLSLILTSGQFSSLAAQSILLSPQMLYFGSTPEGRDAYRYVVIRNISSETLDISQISIQGQNAEEFSIVDDPGSLNISAFGRIEMMINFHPQSAGEKQAQLVFESNAASSPDIVDLSAAGSRSTGPITFEKILGTIEGDGASDVRPTVDGGFIICGSTDNIDEESSDAHLMKTNNYGEVEWMKTYDSDDNDENSDGFSSVLPVSDGYLAVGSTDNGSRDLDLWVVKTDLDGEFQWDLLLGDTDNDGASIIEPTSDGNFIIAGYTIDPDGVTQRDGYLVKLKGDGTELWSKIIGGENSERFSSIKETTDGFILCGTVSTGGIGSDMYVVKTNASGEVSWEKQFGNAGEENVDRGSSVEIAADGGFIFAGRTTSFGAVANDVYVIKTDASGNKDTTWGDKIFGEDHHDGASEVIHTSDGGYLIAGSIENHYEPLPINDWYSDVYIIKLDPNGNFQWETAYGGNRGEGANTVRELEDGTFILIGGTSTYGSNADGEIYFLRVNEDGNIVTAIDEVSNIIPEKMHLDQNYPNPFNGSTTISYNVSKSSRVQLKVFDLTGRHISTLVDDFQMSGFYKVSFDANALASGVYLYQLATESFSETKKLLLIK